MKFMLVNHAPSGVGATCSACSRPLGASYVRHVPTERRYCNQDCYRRSQEFGAAMPWAAAVYRSSFETIVVLTAIASWSFVMQVGAASRVLTETILRAGNHMPAEEGDD